MNGPEDVGRRLDSGQRGERRSTCPGRPATPPLRPAGRGGGGVESTSGTQGFAPAREPRFDVELIVADGELADRLRDEQAQAIKEVLEWARSTATPPSPEPRV